MRRQTFLFSMLAASAALAVGGCRVNEPPPFRPETIQALQVQSAGQYLPVPMRRLPTELESPFLPQGPAQIPQATTRPVPIPATQPLADQVVRLSLQEAIQRAVRNNLDVRVAGYDPAIDAMRVIEAQARFDPILFGNYQFQDQENSRSFSSDPLLPVGLQSNTFQGGVRQTLATGGQVELRQQVVRNDIDRLFATGVADVYYDNELVLQVTQPLFRDAGEVVNRARIEVARNDRKISLLDFQLRLERNLAELEEAYWRLILAVREVEILEELLNRTIEMADVLARRWGQDVSNVQLSQANATIEARRSALVRARARVQDLSDSVKRLMNDPELPVSGPVLVLPSDAPVLEPIRFRLQEQISAAMENRPELLQQLLRVDTASTIVKVGRNNLLPQLNLVGSVGAEGIDPDFSQAFDNELETDLVNYSIGVTFEVPIGNRAPRAIYQRTLLQRQQAIDQYALLVEQVTEEVKRAQREVETSWNEIAATREARLAAAEALRAIEIQEDDVARTPPFVQLKLDRQAALAEAARAEITAVTNYNLAVSALERTKGTLLRYNNVIMAEALPAEAICP